MGGGRGLGGRGGLGGGYGGCGGRGGLGSDCCSTGGAATYLVKAKGNRVRWAFSSAAKMLCFHKAGLIVPSEPLGRAVPLEAEVVAKGQ